MWLFHATAIYHQNDTHASIQYILYKLRLSVSRSFFNIEE